MNAMNIKFCVVKGGGGDGDVDDESNKRAVFAKVGGC